MKIIIVTGSPHKTGTSNTLAQSFIKGAKESGHQIMVFDAASMNLHPCQGCYHCSMTRKCKWDDDMQEAIRAIFQADMLVFVTPIYYYEMTSQLKTFIDRFHCVNGPIKQLGLKTAMIAAAWNSNQDAMDGIKNHYKLMVKYMNLENMGEIYAYGCSSPGDLRYTDYEKQAYELGRNL